MLRILSIAGGLALAVPVVAQEPPPAPEKELDAAVAADWPRFDHGGKGHLTHDEFSTWLITLRSQSNGAGEDPAKLKAWAETSFVSADGDSDKRVSPEEFTAFLRSKIKK
ncbi:hypothetical protein [Sphingomonas cavernae]|uniref:EF-hand domain-containing protein n=1 Tax=Sphingomonas cavernae TaxID=2320861 RepID=A0A418W612_9SPHN|nr:hypothetical protein [Sphingomonas cavernae]RJF85471.1 hypothetical protein D3876_16165 [Sphingomonas cavernae]